MEGGSTPLCRCRVLYLGNSVPTITKDGLQGIQEPLRKLYPVEGLDDTRGIDGWLSVWMNGILLQYADDPDREQFFPIDSLHYCAAVRFVNITGYMVAGGCQQFLPLNSPLANLPESKHPPIFAPILRRTTGVRVLECHAFVCTTVGAANALVKCCFEAFAESTASTSNVNVLRPDPSGLDSPRLKGAPQGASSDKSSSSNASDWAAENGYESDTEKVNVANWHERQQSGQYDAASLSSSTAGRYKKKETTTVVKKRRQKTKDPNATSPRMVENPYMTYSRALVPYHSMAQDAALIERHRSFSDVDLRRSRAAYPMDEIVPFEPYITYPRDTLPYDQMSTHSARQSNALVPEAMFGPPAAPFPFMPFSNARMMPPPAMMPHPPPPLLGYPPMPMEMNGPPMVMVPPPRRNKKQQRARRNSHPNIPFMMPPPPPPFPMFSPFEGMGRMPGPAFAPMPMLPYAPFGPMRPPLQFGPPNDHRQRYAMNGKASQAFPKMTEHRQYPPGGYGLDQIDTRMREMQIRDEHDVMPKEGPKQPKRKAPKQYPGSVQMMY